MSFLDRHLEPPVILGIPSTTENKWEQFRIDKQNKYSLHKLLKNKDVCEQCLIRASCTKSFIDGSACNKFKKAIEEALSENKFRFHNK